MDIEKTLHDLSSIVLERIKSHFEQRTFHLPKWVKANTPGLLKFKPDPAFGISGDGFETIILMTALAPHLRPGFFESLIQQALPNGGDFPEFGGVKGFTHRGMLPTGETVQFILAGANDIRQRLAVHHYFSQEHFFYQKGILWLEPVKEGEPKMSGRVIADQEWMDKLLLGKENSPRFGIDFPAQKIATAMNWDDAVLHPQTAKQINDISIWLKHSFKLMNDKNLSRKLKPGYRVLFYGPSGTGKTMTAALLGKSVNKEVYRVDLSQIVSKYIGETEKNLETVFKKAESKDWILFFDEADALFGKRTQVQSSHDRYANQEVSYLLQRIEDYKGLLILASNFKANLDDAFLRRFHSIIHFPAPQKEERLLLWQKAMPQIIKTDEDVNLEQIASKFELTGASVLNIVQYATLKAISNNAKAIHQHDIIDAVRRELMKEEKNI